MSRILADLCVSPGATLREVMECIDANTTGIALLVGEDRKLLATITDGDIRRAILRGLSLDLKAEILTAERTAVPVTALEGSTEPELMSLMKSRGVRQLPLVSLGGNVTGFVTLDDFAGHETLPVRAVIMAGGAGLRLRPLTNDIPKPMLPLADRPMLERMVRRIRTAGIQSIHLTTHYKSEVIKEHFGDGSDFGVDIRYLDEAQPLGTAGSLGLLRAPDLDRHLLVMNGDILTGINFEMLLAFHKEQDAAMTVVVKEHTVEVPYGVVEFADDGVAISGITEKPTFRYFINAGIYLLNPSVCQMILPDRHFDMTDLIARLLEKNQRVVSFPNRDYWLDIGQKSDYARAQSDVAAGHF